MKKLLSFIWSYLTKPFKKNQMQILKKGLETIGMKIHNLSVNADAIHAKINRKNRGEANISDQEIKDDKRDLKLLIQDQISELHKVIIRLD